MTEHTDEHDKIWLAVGDLKDTVSTMAEEMKETRKEVATIQQLVEPVKYIADTMKGLRVGVPIVSGLFVIILALRELNILN